MELVAALEALKHIPSEKDVLLYTDSQYLKNGVESWMKDWKAREWKRKGGKLKNVDLWKQISDEIDKRRITWRWVKGHNNNPFNERADRLGTENDEEAEIKKDRISPVFAEATTGFEPVIRVLQTLAFPLGHVALR